MSGEDRYEKKQRGTPAPKKHAAAKIAKRLYGLLDRRQKIGFLLIVVIMAVSAALAQMTPKAIGWLTDDLLAQRQMAFGPVLPFLGLILVVNVGNELIKILRRVMVEDTATRTEKKARGLVIRALLRAPQLLILDEATAALDNTCERSIQQEIERLKEEGGTVLSIAHRLTTLENCDEILVFDRGKICQTGSYRELIAEDGIFSDMYHGLLK